MKLSSKLHSGFFFFFLFRCNKKTGKYHIWFSVDVGDSSKKEKMEVLPGLFSRNGPEDTIAPLDGPNCKSKLLPQFLQLLLVCSSHSWGLTFLYLPTIIYTENPFEVKYQFKKWPPIIEVKTTLTSEEKKRALSLTSSTICWKQS